MTKEKKEKKGETKGETFETLKALYYSGKVKPALNKIRAELENDAENLELSLLACKCLVRAKDYKELLKLAEACIEMDSKMADAYYYRGLAIQHKKGKEQEAIKNFNEALALEPDNAIYLKGKASTHHLLFTDYQLPVSFAEKYKIKAQENLLKAIELIEQKENPNYIDYWTIAEANAMISRNTYAKKYFIKAIDAYNNADKSEQDVNIYKDIIKAQKACIKLMDKIIED